MLLGGLWFALHLPTLTAASKEGAWPQWLLIVIFGVGVLAGPVLMIVVGGDEIVGCLGVVAALVLGWSSANLAVRVWSIPEAQHAARLCGAALGPLLLYAGIHAVLWWADRRQSGQRPTGQG